MASQAGGDGAQGLVGRDIRDETSDSESGSSFMGSGSDESGAAPAPCPWRTREFHDQECSRYFDCPSHVVERSLSDAVDGNNEGTEQENQDEDENQAESSRTREGVVSGSGTAADSSDSSRPSSPELGELSHAPRMDSVGETSASARTMEIRGEASSSSAAPLPVPRLDLPPRTASLPQRPALVSPGMRVAGPRDAPLPRIPGDAPQRQTGIRISSPRGPTPPGSSVPAQRGTPDIALPRWQPDAEVTYCPICYTQFSIFVRKHHCRKCGRVVCNSCSPHRITIPYQYIVLPPTQTRSSQFGSFFADDGEDFSGGGRRVRLCNPCVPDPNTTPPQPLNSPSQNQLSPRAHYRSQSSASGGVGGFLAPGPAHDHARSRSITMNSSAGSPSRNPYPGPTGNRILSGTPPVYYHPYRSDYGGPSSSSQRALPPTPQIAEEDECPVCHRELPSRTLPNYEGLREAHINICITAHSTYSGSATSPGSSTTPGVGGVPGEGSTPPPLSARRTGMFPYKATEKDCVDSAECTICLEEFEVGVLMARLECLCRFHKSCISAWFVNHPGRCPVHQHDSFGF